MAAATEVADLDSSVFTQVVFTDIAHCYSSSSPVVCNYTVSTPFQPSNKDWVGIFKVGWSTTRDYHTFVWVRPPDEVGEEPLKQQVLFQDYYLPRDESEFYQFCYIDAMGQVRGASTSFRFTKRAEEGMDCSLENDLLVITTQEQIDRSVQKTEELVKELAQMREQNKTITSSLTLKEEEYGQLKEQAEQSAQEIEELRKELSQMTEQNETIRNSLMEREEENNHLKKERTEEELMKEINELMAQNEILKKTSQEQQQEIECFKEKYDKAVVKINQLKQEKVEVMEKAEVQTGEIADLKLCLRESQQEQQKLKDTIQLLEVDLHSIQNDKRRTSAQLQRSQSLSQDLEELKRENEKLRSSLSQKDSVEYMADGELKYQTLLAELEDVRAQLATEKLEYKERQRQSEMELQKVTEQLQKVVSSANEEESKSGQIEVKLTEAYAIIKEKDDLIEERDNLIIIERREKEGLCRENQELKRDIERLSREFTDLQTAPPVNSSATLSSNPNPSSGYANTTQEQVQETTQGDRHLYETMGGMSIQEDVVLECRHCRECFPGITQEELDQHEQSHKVCPFCTLICDGMEQPVFEDHVYSHE